MPKLKTCKAAKKRFKQIGPRKFKRKQAFKGHILEKKSPKRKRQLRKTIVANKAETKAICKMLIC